MEEIENTEEYQIPREAIEKLKDPEVIHRQLKEGKTFQEIIGYSDSTMETFYQTASVLFQKQEYQKAADAFVFLTTLNPYAHAYWLGLGMSEQLCGGFQAALLAYAMAVLTQIENPIPHYHSANCYCALGDDENALQSFDMAIRCAGDKEEFRPVRERALASIESLKREK